MEFINNTIVGNSDSTYISKNDTVKSLKNIMNSDSTIFERRHDTTYLGSTRKLEDILKIEKESRNIAIYLQIYTAEKLNLITKDNVVRIMKRYRIQDDKSFTREICSRGPKLRNSKKKLYLSHIKECFSERAKELNIDVSDLEKEFEEAIQTSFTGFWVKFLGILKKKNIAKLENIENEYLNRIEKKEAGTLEKIFHKPFTDKQAECALDKTVHEFSISDHYDIFYDLMCNDVELRKGVPFNGKVDYPSVQSSGTCCIHASINALIQNEKGAHLVNRLLRFDEKQNSLKTCLPEAVRAGINDKFEFDVTNDKDLAIDVSFGDGDIAALVENCVSYSKYTDKSIVKLYRAFEMLSGEHAQLYFTDEAIPNGIGIVTNDNGGNHFYNNIKKMLNDGTGAVICSLGKPSGIEDYIGNYITDLKTEADSGEKAFDSNEHAYSIVKITDDYVYLQESNFPTLYIKMGKELFLKRFSMASTWKYE